MGVQPLARQPELGRQARIRPVREVADARVAQRRGVHADLVGAPGLQVDLEQGGPAEHLERLVVGHGRPAVVEHRELPVVAGMPPDGRVHGAAQRIRDALDHGVVDLLRHALAELVLHGGVGALGLGHDHDPGGADVEPVHDPLALGGTRGGDVVAEGGQGAHHGGPYPAGRGVRGHAGGLVHGHQVLVLVQDAQRVHALCPHFQGVGVVGDVDGEGLPRHGLRGLGQDAVPAAGARLGPHQAPGEPVRQQRAGDAERVGEHRVDPPARLGLGDLEPLGQSRSHAHVLTPPVCRPGGGRSSRAGRRR